ncbi:MAG: hypothetical protein G01um101470_280 [Parcubacteria group bacterium Gr01-1014_70]|nr:MAG: hypothetical protein G01um101470_280 [Parcubacteria group bacterium Gr01-1014_70]
MGILRKMFGFVVSLFRNSSSPIAAASSQPVHRIDAGLYVAVAFLVAGVTLGVLHSGAWIFGGIALALIIIGSTMMEVTEPDRAGYMLFSRYIGPIDSGWHFPIAGIMDCCHRPGKDLTLDLGTMKVFTSRKTPITAKVTVNYRLGSTADDLKNACLRLPKNFAEAEKMFRETAESEIRSVLGKGDFGKLIPEQEILEKQAKEKIADDYKQWGFEVTGVKIRDFDEEVESEAMRIRIQGLAEADVRKANAEVLKDNWQAAAVTIGDSLARAYSGGSGKKGKKKPQEDGGDEAEDKTDQNPVSAVVQGVAQAVRGAVGGRRRRS